MKDRSDNPSHHELTIYHGVTPCRNVTINMQPIDPLYYLVLPDYSNYFWEGIKTNKDGVVAVILILFDDFRDLFLSLFVLGSDLMR